MNRLIETLRLGLLEPRLRLAGTRVRDLAPAILAYGAAVFVAIFATFQFWFRDREPQLDDLGLFNAIYTYMKTGSMGYPVYGMPDEMVVHPPTQYFIVAQLMRLTNLPVEAAVIVLLLTGLCVALLAIAIVPWTLTTRISFIFGLSAGVLYWADPVLMRPDLTHVVLWIAALIFLEAGRLRDWDTAMLVVGSALLALASTLHYPFSAGVAGLLVYAVWVVRDNGLRRSAAALTGMATGAGLVLLPYVVLFVVPDADAISRFTHQVNSGGHVILTPLQQHIDFYDQFRQLVTGGDVLAALASPFTRTGIPVAIPAMVVLILRRETRGLGLASAPHLLFLLLYVQTKNIYYFTAEFTLYFSALSIVVLTTIEFLAVRLRVSKTATVAAVAFAGMTVFYVVESPRIAQYAPFTWHPLHNDMDVARAAGEAILGPGALVGTNDVGLWYITGAQRLQPRLADVTLMKDFSQVNLRRYLSSFSAIAEENQDTWQMENSQRQSIPEWYERGLLRVRGFYFGDRRKSSRPLVRYLLLSAKQQALRGYAFSGKRVFSFRPSTHGDWLFMVASCRVAANLSTRFPARWYTVLDLPGAVYPPIASTRQIYAAVMPMRQYESVKSDVASSCELNESVRLSASHRSVNTFLTHWKSRPQHADVDVVQAVPAASNALFTPPAHTSVVRNALVFDKLQINADAVGRRLNMGLVIRTPAARWSFAVKLPLAKPSRPAWVRVDGQVTRGSVGICILTPDDGCTVRRTLPTDARGGFYLPIPMDAHEPELYLDNQNASASEMRIDHVRVYTRR